MNVVPELRRSLLKAAARQAAPATRRRRRPRLPGVVLTLGAVTALAVVGIVFVLSGSSGPPATSPPPPTGRPAALAAAQRLLAQVQLPSGAVAVLSDQSRPRQLGSPPQGVLPSGAVDVHRFFLMAGDPQTIVNAFQRLNRKLEANGGTGVGEAGARASSGGGPSVPTFANQSSEVSPLGQVRRELQVSVAPAHQGQSAIRIDARAYWTPPRPAYTLIPPGVRKIVVRVSGASADAIGHGLKTSTRLSAGHDVSLVVSFLNALVVARRPGNVSPAGQSCAGTRIGMTFYGAGGRSLAAAVMHPPCGLVEVWSGGAHTVLTLDAPALGFTPQTFYRVLVLLAGVP